MMKSFSLKESEGALCSLLLCWECSFWVKKKLYTYLFVHFKNLYLNKLSSSTYHYIRVVFARNWIFQVVLYSESAEKWVHKWQELNKILGHISIIQLIFFLSQTLLFLRRSLPLERWQKSTFFTNSLHIFLSLPCGLFFTQVNQLKKISTYFLCN